MKLVGDLVPKAHMQRELCAVKVVKGQGSDAIQVFFRIAHKRTDRWANIVEEFLAFKAKQDRHFNVVGTDAVIVKKAVVGIIPYELNKSKKNYLVFPLSSMGRRQSLPNM